MDVDSLIASIASFTNLAKVKYRIIPVCIFFLTFFLYVHHLSSSVYGGDTGDYLSAIAVHGVAHPSGYPLYTLLGIFMSFLPLPHSLAWKVGILSAFFSSLALVVLYLIVLKLSKNIWFAIVTSFTLAFVFPFWLFAEVAEVFALYNFFLLLLFYIALLFYFDRRTKYLYLLSFFTGLAFANHELTSLLLPSLGILLLAVGKKNRLSMTVILRCIGLFIIGLLPYIYIPIAASHMPPINWDNASTLHNFLLLVTRGEYGWNGVGGSLSSGLKYLSLQEYVSYIISPQYILILAFAFFGIVGAIRKKHYTILGAICLAFLLFGPIFAYYWGGFDTDNLGLGIFEKFFTSSIIFLILLMPYGISYFGNFLEQLVVSVGHERIIGQRAKLIALLFAIITPLTLLVTNISITDLHNLRVGDQFGKDLLIYLPKNSFLVEQSDDTIFFTTRYMQYAENVRKDVSVVSTSDFERYVKGQRPISTRERPSGLSLHDGFVIGLHTPIFNVVKDYNDLIPAEQATGMPYGLLYFRPPTSFQPLSEDAYLRLQQPILTALEKSVHTIPSIDSLSRLRLIADIPLWYARAFANTGAFLVKRFGDYKTARGYFQKSLAIDPNIDAAYEGLGDYDLVNHDCTAAKLYYEKATDIGFLTKRYYAKLYYVVNSCLHDATASAQLRYYFGQHRNFFGDITHQQTLP